ncbi:DUF4974 domain-containing protein [Bacteroides thetaiotaomicron]|nr:DUF4974 domain-containing protein [Bacteroides thetaiotaomicron]
MSRHCITRTPDEWKSLKTNASKACDWLDGGLTFENASFADIAHRLERKFQVKISIESERLKAEHFSGYSTAIRIFMIYYTKSTLRNNTRGKSVVTPSLLPIKERG